MIFVTVGTHEQSFNRLIRYMDQWAKEHDEEVIVQLGYTKLIPQNCRYFKIAGHNEYLDLINRARIVITHGGPCCFTKVLKSGKIPVVVPRQKRFGEHVDDHQMDISCEIEQRNHNIIVVKDVEQLGDIISNYEKMTEGMNKNGIEINNKEFCRALSEIVDNMFM